jgi:hypothetical protein
MENDITQCGGIQLSNPALDHFIGARHVVPQPNGWRLLLPRTPIRASAWTGPRNDKSGWVVALLVAVIFMWSSASLASRNAYVINNLAETMSQIDLETGAVQNHITTLGQTPNQIAYHDGFLYVVNSISADVQKIDPQTYQVVSDISLPVGSNPYSIDFWGNYAYVTGWISGKIYRINLISDQSDGEIEIDGYPEGIIYINGQLFVAQTAFNQNDYSYGQGQIAVIDPGVMSLESEINVGKNPQAFGLAPDGTLHLVCTGNYADVAGAIYIIDPISATVEDSIVIGGQPASVAIFHDGTAYLAAGGWVDHGFIFSYNTSTRQILHGPANPILVDLGVTAVAVDSLGYLYSCDFGSDEVSKCNSSGQVLNTYQMGDGPNSIVILDDALDGIHDEAPSLPYQSGLPTCYPNPFNGQVAIRYRFSSAENKSPVIEIYDITGRIIKSLRLETNREQGIVIWNGDDNNDKGCASGVYFARLVNNNDTPAKTGSQRILRIILVK